MLHIWVSLDACEMEAAILHPHECPVLTWSCKGLWDRMEMNRFGCLAGKLLVMYGPAKLCMGGKSEITS